MQRPSGHPRSFHLRGASFGARAKIGGGKENGNGNGIGNGGVGNGEGMRKRGWSEPVGKDSWMDE